MTDLKTWHGVLQELDDCSNGLLWFDHLYAQALDDLENKEGAWESVRADAARAAREDAPKAATATEINGRITEWVNDRPSARQARDDFRRAENEKAKIERWIRSLERRGNLAQTAKGIHEKLMEGGG